MKMHGITLAEGSDIVNLTVDQGTSFPDNPSNGELFFRNDASPTVRGLYLYVGGSWDRIASSDAITVPTGVTLPGTANEGDLFYLNSNDANENLYVFKNGVWAEVGSGAGSVDWEDVANTPTTLSGYGITDAQPLDSDLTAIAGLSTTGIVIRTTEGAVSTREIAASGIGLTITNGSGVGGNPTVVSNASSTNDPSTLVARNASGNFSAGTITAALNGNAATATQLQTARNFSLTGDVTASAISFDGTGNVVLSTTLSTTGVSSGSYGSASNVATFIVNSHGRITSAASTPIFITEAQIQNSGVLARTASDDTITGNWSFSNPVTVATPTQAAHAATKEYVDATAQGLTAKPAVEIATTANLTATYNNGTAGVGATLTATANGAFPTIDGVTLTSTVLGENGVLVKNQTNPAHNGRYNLTQVGNVSQPWILTRCGLCDEAGEIPGSYVFVKRGTLYAGTGWVQTVANPSTFVVGTDAITVTQFSGAGAYTAGAGLSSTGTTFNIGTASASRIVINSDDIDLATTGVTPGTYTSVTVDAYGRATGGTNPTTLAGYGITDAQPLDSDLTAVAGLTTTGFISRTGAGTAVTRSVAVSGTGLSVTNPDGISGNPTITSNATSANTVSTLVARDGSGNFSANRISLADAAALVISNAAGTARRIVIQTSGSGRWQFGGDGTAESGSNSGTDFVIYRYDDAGSLLGIPFSISRATGNATFSGSVTASSFSGNASSATNATNISGGSTGQVLYQSGTSTTSFVTNAAGVLQALTSGATPTWTTAPTLTGTNFSGIPNAALTNSSVTVGTTNIALGASSTTLAGLTSVSSTSFTGALTGNASTATTLATGRTFSVSGDATGTSAAFNGSANATIPVTLATVNSNVGSFGTASSVGAFTVNAKGLITAASNTSIAIAASQVNSGTFADARIAASNVTQHQASLTILESQITDGSLLARNAGNETITGTWSFSNPVTVATPTASTHAATKEYVDTAAQGLAAKPAVELATTANLTATYNNGTAGVGATLTATSNGAFPTIDGITLTSTTLGSNGVLVKNQTNPAHNGRYNLTQVGNVSQPWILTRCGVCDEASEIPGSYVFVKAGTQNGGTGWVQTVANPSTFVVGTDDITVTQFSGAGTYTAGTGLSLSGTQFSLATSNVLSLFNLATNGLVARTAANTVAARSITQPAAGITVTNGDGVSGNPTLALANDLLAVENLTTTGIVRRTGTDTWSAGTAVSLTGEVTGTLPIGNGGTGGSTAAAARTNLGATTVGANLFTLTNPSAISFIRVNADNTVSALDAAAFRTAIGAGTGSVTSVNLTQPAAGITVSGGPITSSGNITLALANDLAAVEGLASTGIAVRSGSDTWVTRSIAVSGTGLSITNADGASGNPTVTSNATSANTASTIVARDGSGNFSAGGITMTAGTVSSATGRVGFGTDSGGSISIGRIDGTSSSPYIDFNSGATLVDYDTRIMASAGNGSVGGGNLTFYGSAFVFDTGGVRFADGSAAAPSITFSADTNTGLFRQATDTVSVVTNGTEAVRISDTSVRFFEPVLDALSAVGNVTGATSISLSNANYITFTVTGNATLTFTNPPVTGVAASFIFDITNGGAFTITWPGSVTWITGSAPSLRSSGRNLVGFITLNGGTSYLGFLIA